MQRELNAKGLRRSGAMLKKTLKLCSTAIEDQTKTVKEEYGWASKQALLASQSWINELALDAITSMKPLLAECNQFLTIAAQQSGRPELAELLQNKLNMVQLACNEDITLSMRSIFAERSRGLLRTISVFLPRIVTKIFGGGAT